MPECEQILPGLWRYADTCNVYVIVHGRCAIAVDFGSGRWFTHFAQHTGARLEHVFLTHHHADQCSGLQKQQARGVKVHAPAGEECFLDPGRLSEGGAFDGRMQGCPASYSVLRQGVPGIHYDVAGWQDVFWGGARLRFVPTPGHGPNACSMVADIQGRQVVFCGDAVCEGGTIWQPYHLEWDHWTGTGALAAWEGIERLCGIRVDLLCPSHGSVVGRRPKACLRALSRRLLAFYRVKGQISPDEEDAYVEPRHLRCGAREMLPDLYRFGSNGVLLVSKSGEGLVVDVTRGALPALAELLRELGDVRVSRGTATHYHGDHADGLPALRRKYGARVVLHPRVSEGLRARSGRPFLPRVTVRADRQWPETGTWTWHEFTFRVAPWAGQTWWHCVFMTKVAGQKVMFGGDSFQPSSRWNGTGGFCAYNRSRFRDGFERSARLALAWQPDLLVCGHGTAYRFRASKFRKIAAWSRRAEKAVEDLCPSGDLENDYYAIEALARPRRRGAGRMFWEV